MGCLSPDIHLNIELHDLSVRAIGGLEELALPRQPEQGGRLAHIPAAAKRLKGFPDFSPTPPPQCPT